MEAEKSGLPPWIVLDVRLAREGVYSGVSRFVRGFSRALSEELRERRASGRVPDSLRLMFASKHEPASWAIDLVRQYPEVASFWSGGRGALNAQSDEPMHKWSTDTVVLLKKYTHGDVFWVAPGNCDRPDVSGCLFGKKNCGNVVQIVQDVTPFVHPKVYGFWAGIKYRRRVRSALSRLPLVFSVTESAAEVLRGQVKSNSAEVRALGVGVDDVFGADHRPVDASEKRFLRRDVLVSAGFSSPSGIEQDFVDRKWILGLGNSRAYKRWDIAEKAVESVRRSTPCLLVRVDGSPETVKDFVARGAERMGTCLYLKDKNTLLVPMVSDEALAILYRVSDVFVHPSMAERFGTSPIEALFSGLPVLYQKNAAIDAMVLKQNLPEYFWRCVNGEGEAEWGQALSEMLNPNAQRDKAYAAMAQARSPRAFILERAGMGSAFEWRASARAFLDALEGRLRAPVSGDSA
jgi:glycosyltransferase involved in cell wall biosynthesis